MRSKRKTKNPTFVQLLKHSNNVRLPSVELVYAVAVGGQ